MARVQASDTEPLALMHDADCADEADRDEDGCGERRGCAESLQILDE